MLSIRLFNRLHVNSWSITWWKDLLTHVSVMSLKHALRHYVIIVVRKNNSPLGASETFLGTATYLALDASLTSCCASCTSFASCRFGRTYLTLIERPLDRWFIWCGLALTPLWVLLRALTILAFDVCSFVKLWCFMWLVLLGVVSKLNLDYLWHIQRSNTWLGIIIFTTSRFL